MSTPPPVGVGVGVFIHYAWVSARGDQKRASKFLELELQVFVNYPVWILGTKLCPLEPLEEYQIFLS